MGSKGVRRPLEVETRTLEELQEVSDGGGEGVQGVREGGRGRMARGVVGSN